MKICNKSTVSKASHAFVYGNRMQLNFSCKMNDLALEESQPA